MYRYCIPQVVDNKRFDMEKLAADLRLAKADRVLLALPPLNYDKKKQDSYYDALRPAIEYFKKEGFEVSVWFWAFWVDGDTPFQPFDGFNGKSANEKCPLDPAFLDFVAENLRIIADMHPDLILFDDDLRTGNFDSGIGCFCDRHRALMEQHLNGEKFPKEDLLNVVFGGKPNKYRSAFLRATGYSLEQFCEKARAAVDEVDPSIRIGACSCLTVWDVDGTDSYTIAHKLAGKNTKPYTRLIGAPYWAACNFGGARIAEVVEMERMECSWNTDPEMEIWPEGDAYPRPRHNTSGALMEIYDTALRASGGFAGNQKYIFDYTSSMDYERGYLKMHMANYDKYDAIDRLFNGKEAVGIRNYECMKKVEDGDYTDKPLNTEYFNNQIHSSAARLLSVSAIPTTYTGAGMAGIAFGECARHLPKEAFDKPLILDADAAKILTEQGIDVGAASFGKMVCAANEHFIADDEYTHVYEGAASVREFTLKDGAKVLSEFIREKTIPAAYTYENADGNKFLVFTFAADMVHDREGHFRNYERPKQIADFLKDCGAKLPAFAANEHDIYFLMKADEKEAALGVWNCGQDYVSDYKIELGKAYKGAEFVGCEGTLDGDKLTIKYIPAFEFGFVRLY